jgi:type IV pilus assembly protein PilA
MHREDGFTLIELLVVVLIIAILAAIAIPVFVRQREKAWVAQSQSTAKNAATSAESYSVETGGDFIGLDGDDGTILRTQGFKPSLRTTIAVAANANEYCFTVTHLDLPAAHPWKISTYNSTDGSPRPNDLDAC